MKVGTTVGPHIDVVEGDTDSFDFVEPALNPGTIRSTTSTPSTGATNSTPLAWTARSTSRTFPTSRRQSRKWTRASDSTRSAHWTWGDPGRHEGCRPREDPPERRGDRAAFVEQASWLAEAAAERGVELTVENMGYSGGFTLDELPAVVEEAGASVCFDVGHAFREGGQDAVESFLADHGDMVSHLHVHDARSRGDDHIPVGTGEVDFVPVMEWAGAAT